MTGRRVASGCLVFGVWGLVLAAGSAAAAAGQQNLEAPAPLAPPLDPEPTAGSADRPEVFAGGSRGRGSGSTPSSPNAIEDTGGTSGNGGTSDPGGTSDASGPDMTFCQLFALGQYGRLADIVGLSVSTTSWNIGDAELPWHAIPASDHPFIVMNLYRRKPTGGADRFEQIGQSWIKHAYCALDDSQCSTQCAFPTGCGTLNVGCTDTYSAGLNASQEGLGPRYEVNPWTRGWTYENSHLSLPLHAHDPIQHRMQVHDADLDPLQNPGAEYFVEGYYVCPRDVNQMNSAAWKPVTVSGTPGSQWAFAMSGFSTLPFAGFAIDAWAGATRSILAQEQPVIEFASPDGRCVLAAKAAPLGGGMWHYEYALLNVDMDRQAGSFSVPKLPDTMIENVGFHAAAHHDEPFNTTAADAVAITNDPWTADVSAGAVTWTTTSNPLRWGTMYSFRFDANIDPGNTTVTVGLFRPGTPAEITGNSLGPRLLPPDCNENGVPDACDLSCSAPECTQPCGTSADCNDNGVPDECETDCNGNGVPDDCDIAGGASPDCQADGIPDECQLTEGDCNTNDVPDYCDIAFGGSSDCHADGVPDECQLAGNDCNGNDVPDDCDIEGGLSNDCDQDGTPDECVGGIDCDHDLCENAIAICPGTIVGTTSGMDSDGASTCGFSSASPDVWYRYTPAQNGTLTIQTCGAGTTYDTVLSIHSGCPGTAANQIECDDDDCPGVSNRSTITRQVTAGTTYVFRVTGYFGATGTYMLGVEGPPCLPTYCLVGPQCHDGDPCTADTCNQGLCGHSPGVYGDLDGESGVDMLDIMCVLDAFGGFGACADGEADIAPCAGDGTVDLLDILAILDAFSAIDPCCSGGR